MRSDPPFEPAVTSHRPPTDAEMLEAARAEFARWRHDDVLGSLARLDNALYGRGVDRVSP